ncbi:murein hydrolase activator EnvC [Accumulibacter sp.]|uniref:murein hydrolase activator EnvC family protein n=1 Tax=Accumulibacter sp. TaxID=2053492 RepID=UPI0025E824BE|nr:peptidoglycan DD-metalloendopeptidase family protein [Accumulibacter sp.]MCM8595706.1 peptidoglycan DD-metalloendopeptidase family protein [Accumulibacter sp.]MCM8625333.1 peptidoglycan DD-metalloendopeptidase family protein [Accumulibacter sp.]MDS4049853.1 peptidoglycan DD-metalloendopeptidase family protein [Accumulibacter sp.]
MLALLLAIGVAAPGWPASVGAPAKNHDSASSSQVAARQSDLNSLRAQIATLRREMAATEGSRRTAADQLQEVEQSISTTQRELHELNVQIVQRQSAIRELGRQARDLEEKLGAQQALLERLLYRQYLRGNPDPLRLFLNGEDPNQLARDLYYLEAIGRSRSRILDDIDSALKSKQALVRETHRQGEELTAIEARQKADHARLLVQREERQAVLARISDQISAQRREIGSLQKDERRLAELVSRLSKLIASTSAVSREPRRDAPRRDSAASGAAAETKGLEPARPERESRPTAPSETDEPPADHAPAGASASLAKLRGQLRLPARGSISNRFGSQRQEGGTWKGLFILASAGSEVRSIAGGRVVFAEWMRGFGNLLIVDHGSSYLSIYANNDALLKQVGDTVRTGEAIATVGNSGGNPESGLYFELRHQGKPLDPMAWVGAK